LVFDGTTGAVLVRFSAYPTSFVGGVFVAAGDVNGDGVPDIITGAGQGGPPDVRVFDGKTILSGQPTLLFDFYAYDPAFTGGVRVATGDVNGDGYADIITGPGPGGGPQVNVYDLTKFQPSASGQWTPNLGAFYAYNSGFIGGVFVAAGDVNGDGYADIITGAGPGGGPMVAVFDGKTASQGKTAQNLARFFSYEPRFGGGVTVAVGDVNGDGIPDMITGPASGGGQQINVLAYDGGSGAWVFVPTPFYAFDPSFSGGVFVAAPSSGAHMAVDSPQTGTQSSATLAISGWALNDGATAPNVDAVVAWAWPVSPASGCSTPGCPTSLGTATLLDPRPDVASFYGASFLASGFHLTATTALPAGTYDIVVSARNATTQKFNISRTVRVTVTAPPSATPLDGQTSATAAKR
jgi:hypothetical protein